jgi:hypothetical protein
VGVVVVVAGVLVAGCAGKNAEKAARDAEQEGRLPTPTYAPETSTSTTTREPTTTAPAGDGTTTTAAPGTSATSTGAPSTTARVFAAPAEATITDPVGDATRNVVAGNPSWADLAGAKLVRGGDGYELRIRLADTPPTSAPDNRTMNIASYYDIDGDGTVDYEVWTTLADNGWGSAWYDDRRGRASFADKSGVTAAADGAEVVLRFSADLIGSPATFRWSLASEYGTYEQIGTPIAAADSAPDGNRPTTFPN